MKTGKKILTAIFMIAAMMGMGLAAFAGETSDTYSITITNVEAGHPYTAYQIFKGDVTEGSIGNIEWGSGITSQGISTIYSHYGLTDDNQTAAKAAAELAAYDAGSSAATEDDARAVDFANIFPKQYSYYVRNGVSSNYDKNTGTATISGLAPGYYLIIDSKEPSSYYGTVDPAYTLSRRMVQLVGENVTIINKVVQPGVDKKIVVGDEDKTETDAAIGETVSFKITSAVPNCEGYKNYVMTFADTMDKGLTLDESSLVVKVGEQTLTKDDYTLTVADYVPTSSWGGDTYLGGKSIRIEMKIKENNADQKYAFGQPITITYGAELNEKARVVGFGGQKTDYIGSYSINQNYNANKVKLIYSNDPNSDGTGETRDVEVRVWTYEFQIVKTKNLENNYFYIDTLYDAKAEFRLYEDEDCTKEIILVQDGSHRDAYWGNGGARYLGGVNSPVYRLRTAEEIAQGKTGDVIKAGHPYVSGLKCGTYYLKEIKAPEGYTLMSPNPRKVEISRSSYSLVASFFGPYGTNGNVTSTTELYTYYDCGYHYQKEFHAYDYSSGGIHVIDEAGSTLPSTGGIGTTIFYVIGAVLVIGAGVLLVTRKRTDAVK